MSKIDEMLKNEKVEWKRLGEKDVCISITTGLNPRKNFKLNDSSNGELTSWYITTKDYSSNEVIEFIDGKTARITEKARKLINKRSKLQINDILFSAVGTVGKIAFVEVEPNNFDVNESTFVLKPNKKNIVPKYLVYYLRSDFIQNEVKKSLKGSTLAGIRKNKLEELVIPIPSIETQEKIVKTLDKFTNYVTELQAELQARTKQCEYYRNLLLSEEYLNKLSENPEIFRGGEYRVKLTTLGEIGEIQMCKRILKNQTSSKGDIPFYKIGTFGKIADSFISQELFNEYKKKYSYPKKGEILISASGTIGRTVIFDGEDAYFQDSNIVWVSHNEEIVINKYLYYLYQVINWNPSTGGTINRLYNYNLKNIKVILPPIEIQNKVVQILDKFQSLLSDTKGLLPQEIEQRQKQYEYYREKLLTFDIEGETISRQTDRQVISSDYFVVLKEAADIVGAKIFSNVHKTSLKTIAKYSIQRVSAGALNEKNYVGVENLLKDKVGKVDSSYVPKTGSLIAFKKGDILIGNIRPYLRKIWIADIDGGTNGDVLAISIKENFENKIVPRFLYQILANESFFEYDIKFSKGAKMPRGDKKKIMEYEFLLPYIPVQEYVVSILDRFDALIHDVSKGIPKEIELRQRQYEYYREKLLDFKRSN